MDAAQVKAFCDAAAQLLPQITAYASAVPSEHTPADDALVRQLRVAGSAINYALQELARMSPPPMPPMPPPASPPKPGS